MWNDFETNEKLFWKVVRRVRRGEMVKDENSKIFRDTVEVRRRWESILSRY